MLRDELINGFYPPRPFPWPLPSPEDGIYAALQVVSTGRCGMQYNNDESVDNGIDNRLGLVSLCLGGNRPAVSKTDDGIPLKMQLSVGREIWEDYHVTRQ